MKQGIHPELKDAAVRCLCGNEFTTKSIRDSISVEVCAACHPFFTGQKRVVDTAGRVERFTKRAGERSYGQKKPGKK